MLKVEALVNRTRSRADYATETGPKSQWRAVFTGVAVVVAIAIFGAAAGWIMGTGWPFS